MSNRSDAVKRWRRSVKERAVKMFGGKCEICGYKKCSSALEFHHLNPEEKDFAFGRAAANPKSLQKIQNELVKCVMVCSNCHKEIHANITKIPKRLIKNRPSVLIESLKPVKEYDTCPICGKPKPIRYITCSLKCAAKKSRKVDWDSIDLAEALKSKSMCKLAEELGISEAAVRKRKNKLKL